jgi:hypothetical protein
VDNAVMSGSRVVVFSVGQARRQSTFLAWASLVGPEVALMHVPKGFRRAPDGRPCHCEIFVDGVAEEAIGATVRRTSALRPAPPFVFLDSSSRVAVTDVSDPRFWSSDLTQVRAAMWDFVAAEAASDPVYVPRPGPIESVGRASTEAGPGTPDTALPAGAAKPWWCKLFRSAPGC